MPAACRTSRVAFWTNLVHLACAALNAGEYGLRFAPAPEPMLMRSPWPPGPVVTLGSGKSGTPFARMHTAALTEAWLMLASCELLTTGPTGAYFAHACYAFCSVWGEASSFTPLTMTVFPLPTLCIPPLLGGSG